MSRVSNWIACVAIVVLTSCAAPDAVRNETVQRAVFPSGEFVRFLSKEQQALSWRNISAVSGSLVWASSDSQFLAITRNDRAVALVEPGANWTTYYLFGGSDKVMKYRVNNRDVEGSIVDFVYEAL